jgi:hypothetical protein
MLGMKAKSEPSFFSSEELCGSIDKTKAIQDIQKCSVTLYLAPPPFDCTLCNAQIFSFELSLGANIRSWD